jgi:protein TonB
MIHLRLSNATVPEAAPRERRSHLLSGLAHLMLLALALGVLHGGGARLTPRRRSGTAQGTHLLTYFSSGSAQPVINPPVLAKPVPAQAETARLSVPADKVRPPEPSAAASEKGTGSAELSGLGDGDLKIALQTYFPHPSPDLSSLPRGTRGDVILNAVIDEHGKITELTLLKGLGPAVDDAVMDVVRQWTYTPATRNGTPVASEQELLFHYERG